MRKFTKDHNDIDWLFPNVTNHIIERNPLKTFDELEEIGEHLLDSGYGKQENFTRDDMIDAFMKGASVMNQTICEDIAIEKSVLKEIETIKAIGSR